MMSLTLGAQLLRNTVSLDVIFKFTADVLDK
jgi:hypothetical protein